MNRRRFLSYLGTGAGVAAWAGVAAYATRGAGGGPQLLNASYDATRGLYRAVNHLFAEKTARERGEAVRVRPSHGGSGRQATAVREGLPADVVTLALWPDTQMLCEKAKLIDFGWEDRLPNRSLPYTSTIIFVVRAGNPHGIRDWADLVSKPGLQIIVSNPKTGGAAKMTFLAAWGAVQAAGRDPEEYVRELYRRVPVLESSSRAATQTFAKKRLGDVHITWESEAMLEMAELRGQVEIVYPPTSIRAEPHVAVVDANARRNGTEELAREYLEFLYTPQVQDVIAEYGFRPASGAAAGRFRPIELFGVADVIAGGWPAAQPAFFNDGAAFDRAYAAAR